MLGRLLRAGASDTVSIFPRCGLIEIKTTRNTFREARKSPEDMAINRWKLSCVENVRDGETDN